MQTRPEMTDRTALRHHRARATGGEAMFLHREAAAEIEERLAEVNRTFTHPVCVTGHPALWSELLPDARLIADEEVLDLEPASCDLLIHAMAMHWANDPVGQLIQARRALKPDGLFLGVMPGAQTLTELRVALAGAEAEVMSGLSPRIAPMAEVRHIGGLLQRAGFALPVADTLPLRVTYSGVPALLSDLRAMGETNALADRDRRVPPRGLFARAAELYAAAHPAEGGRIAATFELVFLTGWAPDDNQPKPLRPGSAQARLADALGTQERPARDTVPPRGD